jgi:DNA-binding NarL/FixJ family response regulator
VKRVYILSQQSLFGKGIESLLSQESEIAIVNRDADVHSVVKCIQEYKPDVVIIDCDDPVLDLKSAILCFLRERPNTNIIGLSLENNKVSIYRGEQKQIFQVADLMDIIHGL